LKDLCSDEARLSLNCSYIGLLSVCLVLKFFQCKQFSVLKMDEDQVQAYNLIIGGHNLCLTGQAGTGKSYVAKKTVKELRK
jgi:Cdc6-like AAA superfamily ATPase